MNQVRIYHPALDRVIAVPESAVAIHRNAGWIPADEVGTEPADTGTTHDVAAHVAATPQNTDGGQPEDTPAKDTPATGRRQGKEK